MDAKSRELLARGATALGADLDEPLLELFAIYTSLLQSWGQKINLTSRLSEREILVYHFLDSLGAYEMCAVHGTGSLVDIGAGAGFPALPLKICLPAMKVALIESSGKRAAFCREVVRRLGLENTLVFQGRGEELGKDERHAGRYDFSVVRAVGEAAAMVDLCLPFLRPEGKLILYKGNIGEGEMAGLQERVAHHGRSFEIRSRPIPGLPAERNLIIVA